MLRIVGEEKNDVYEYRRRPVSLIGHLVDESHLSAAKEAIKDTLKVARVDKEIPINVRRVDDPYWMDEYKMPGRNQIDAYKFMLDISSDDEYKFVLTKNDINSSMGNYNFLVGLAIPGYNAIASTKRFEGVNDPQMRWECVKTEVMHEIGHVFGAPSYSRKDIEENLGRHCKNKCVMRQGIRVPMDWIAMTKDRLETGKAFCDSCENDLREFFGTN
ncbi:MAG: hypothetical protein J7K87_01540 [Candidatus Aenigmarchaeota archaeon]|nr:hypothetical protein [Candidatus Aenigmarchaeota archaeon]